ncbi:MAG TPA: carbon storage regulator [Gammaproteobacteria bacterium]|jgi:sRNA-binding carbon storage regulator CsrA|nr:carbon storage regulator [Gammaproteobacteria bacterium]
MSLVLKRRPGQVIVIGDSGEIKITFYRFEDGYAQFGIEAPKSVRVNRLEKLVKERYMAEPGQSESQD